MEGIRLDTPRRKAAAAIGAFLVVILAIALLDGESKSSDPFAGAPSRSVDAAASAVARPSVAGPDVPPIEACELLTDEEIEAAMGIADLPFEDKGLSTVSGREQCRWTNNRDGETVEGLSVQIGPGSQDDFAEGATLQDLPGSAVEGVGEVAAWFGSDSHGIISVADDSSLGYVFLRVLIERQDLDDAGRREVAKQVAAAALQRFPGMAVAEDVVPLTTLDPEPADRSGFGLVDNLLAREAAGEWTRGEGLVETLRLVIGEADADAVLADGEVHFAEGTGVIAMANDYLLRGADAATQEEIAELLDRLVFSSEQLEAMAGLDGAPTESPASAGGVTLAAAHRGPPAAERGFASATEDCRQFFYGFEPVPGVGQCLEWRDDLLDELDADKYRIFVPAPGHPQGGWTDRHFRMAAAAIIDTVKKYEELGELPQINMVFAPLPQPKALASATNQGGGKPCGIFLNPTMLHLTIGPFQQTVAHEIGHCFTAHNYSPQSRLSYETKKWWEEGIAEFLSNLVYPSVNDEWGWRHGLAAIERATSLVDRDYDNYTFFQFIASDRNDREVLRLLNSMPGCGEARADMDTDALSACRASGSRADQASALAAYFGLREKILEFQERMTDATVLDSDGQHQPFMPQADPIDGVTRTLVLLEAFEIGRLHLTIPPGEHACLDYELSGSGRASWRTGPPDGAGIERDWSQTLPESVSGQAVFVTTTASATASFMLEVTDLVDNPRDCEEEGEPGDHTVDCLSLLCGPSNYFRSPDQLEEWMREVLPDLPG